MTSRDMLWIAVLLIGAGAVSAVAGLVWNDGPSIGGGIVIALWGLLYLLVGGASHPDERTDRRTHHRAGRPAMREEGP